MNLFVKLIRRGRRQDNISGFSRALSPGKNLPPSCAADCHLQVTQSATPPATTAVAVFALLLNLITITMTRNASAVLLAVVVVFLAAIGADAFAPQASLSTTRVSPSPALFAKKKEDLSYLETRDMTKEEMLELNKKNEGKQSRHDDVL